MERKKLKKFVSTVYDITDSGQWPVVKSTRPVASRWRIYYYKQAVVDAETSAQLSVGVLVKPLQNDMGIVVSAWPHVTCIGGCTFDLPSCFQTNRASTLIFKNADVYVGGIACIIMLHRQIGDVAIAFMEESASLPSITLKPSK